MCPDVPHFVILLCWFVTLDDLTHQRESAAIQWVNLLVIQPNHFISQSNTKSFKRTVQLNCLSFSTWADLLEGGGGGG
jgi:hypothetical protein